LFDIFVDTDGGVFAVGYVVGDVSADEDPADGCALALVDFEFTPMLVQLVSNFAGQESEVSGLSDG